MGIRIGDARDSGLVRDSLLDQIPMACKCGSELQLSNRLDRLECTNPNCSDKVALRLYAMLNQMGVQGWDLWVCRRFVNQYKLSSPMQIFYIPSLIDQGTEEQDEDTLELLKAACDPKGLITTNEWKSKPSMLSKPELRELTLVEYVKYSTTPTVSLVADDLFCGFDNIETAYSYIKLMEVPFISSRLGFKGDKAVTLAIFLYNKVLECESELKYGEKFFSIKDTEGFELRLVVDNEIDTVRNSRELKGLIERRYKGKFNVMIMPNINNQTDAFVTSGYSNSVKAIKANNLNEQYRFKVENDSSIDKSTLNTREHGELTYINEKLFVGTVQELLKRLDSLALEV